jgi:hypothetical protein
VGGTELCRRRIVRERHLCVLHCLQRASHPPTSGLTMSTAYICTSTPSPVLIHYLYWYILLFQLVCGQNCSSSVHPYRSRAFQERLFDFWWRVSCRKAHIGLFNFSTLGKRARREYVCGTPGVGHFCVTLSLGG